jgi:hypothetical protein
MTAKPDARAREELSAVGKPILDIDDPANSKFIGCCGEALTKLEDARTLSPVVDVSRPDIPKYR